MGYFENNGKCENNFDVIDFFEGKYDLTDKSLLNKDFIIKNITQIIINHEIDDLLYDVIEGKKQDLFIQYDDVLYTITSSENQNNYFYNKTSTIKLGDCQKILKDIYNISQNYSLIIFKIDYFMEGISIPLIGYEIFHPITKEQLNLSYCQENHIHLDIPVEIDENNLFKYDPNSDYYNDECNAYTTENGTDIILNDRKDEYVMNNMSVCENNCSYNNYEQDVKKVICKCQVKSRNFLLSEAVEEENILDNSITSTKKDYYSPSINSMKCINELFTKDGLVKNIGNYVLSFLFISYSILAILFYKCGYHLLEELIKDIIYKKRQAKPHHIKKIKRKKKRKKTFNNPIKKHSKKKTFKIQEQDYENKNDNNPINSYSKSQYFINIKKLSNSREINVLKTLTSHNNGEKNNENNNIDVQNQNQKETFNDYELNSFSYNKALKYDNRTFFQYYISLLKAKHPIIFSFFPINDFNSMIVKISMFVLAFALYYEINSFFFDEKMVHQIYQDGGIFNYIYLFPPIIYSFIISHTICNIIKLLFLSERNIILIKEQKTAEKASSIMSKVERRLFIKNIAYFIMEGILIIYFWLDISSFGAVYQNTQILLFENTLICFSLSFVYPFFINLITAAVRIYSLKTKEKNKERIYKVSKILSFL